MGVVLSKPQEIGLRFYDGACLSLHSSCGLSDVPADINDRMPREEARALFDLIKPIALNIDPKLFVEVMGSYRRYVGGSSSLPRVPNLSTP
jgi:DNA polymerase lambda